jgi:hypothetical protein
MLAIEHASKWFPLTQIEIYNGLFLDCVNYSNCVKAGMQAKTRWACFSSSTTQLGELKKHLVVEDSLSHQSALKLLRNCAHFGQFLPQIFQEYCYWVYFQI